MPISKENLIKQLRALKLNSEDTEEGHIEADDLLIDYINDKEISEAYNDVDKWYA